MSTRTRPRGVTEPPAAPARIDYGSADEMDAALAGSSAEDGYELIDAGLGERLERWGAIRLRRPDPRAAVLTRRLPPREWDAADAWYRGEAGRGHWEGRSGVDLPAEWRIVHDDLTFVIRLAPFKHTGLFPEQAVHWRWMREAARAATGAPASGADRVLRVLNLFAHTGGASIALARDGHLVTHVDASKPAMTWAKENARANELAADAIRWIQDDVPTFVKRERRRGREYDAVLLDPPAFGRAPKGTGKANAVWRVEDDLPPLLDDIFALLVDPVFVVINDYARDADAGALAATVRARLHARGWLPSPASTDVESGRLCLQTRDGRLLDTGGFVRWRAPWRLGDRRP